MRTTVDGASLTVAEVSDDGFDFAVILHTVTFTTLGTKAVGRPPVSLGVGRNVERLAAALLRPGSGVAPGNGG